MATAMEHHGLGWNEAQMRGNEGRQNGVLLEMKCGSTHCGRRAARNLIAPGVGPSLSGMSAHRTVHSQESIAMAPENEKGSRDVP